MPQRELALGGLRTAGEFIRDFSEVREAFLRDPLTFLEKYVQLDLKSLGITAADLPSREELRRQLESNLTSFGPVMEIAICAVAI